MLLHFVCIACFSLAKPKLKDLIHVEVTAEWYSLGLQLDLTEDALDTIENDFAQSSSTCKRKMFSKWLTSNKDASYTTLVDALVKIDKKIVAENVSKKFCKLCSYLDTSYLYTIHLIVVTQHEWSA